MDYDNPAARLLSILERGKAIAGNVICRLAWNELMGTTESQAQLISRLGKVMELPELAVQSLKDEFPHQSQTWAHWEPQVNNAFMVQNLNATWDSFISHIDVHTINYLRLSADLLQSKTNIRLITDDEIRSAREKIDSIYIEVINSNIPEDIKKYLIRNLRKLLVAIDEYRITGALEVLDAVDSVFGHAAKNEGYRNFLTDSELGKKILDILDVTANIIAIATGLPQLSLGIALLPK